MKNKIYHAIGRFFQKVSRWFFHRTLMACWHCGALVGMNSTYTRGHMWCEPCLQRYVMPELHAAQQNAHLTATPSYCPHISENIDGTCPYCDLPKPPQVA